MSAAGALSPSDDDSAKLAKPIWETRLDEEVASRPFAVKTKLGALNLYGLFYGMVSIFLGLIWYVATMIYALLSWITRGKIDKNRRIPIVFAHVWGTLLLKFTGSFPKIENRELLEPLFASKRAAMFVANHNSWMDIPFLGHTIGWRNYKMVAKQELQKGRLGGLLHIVISLIIIYVMFLFL